MKELTTGNKHCNILEEIKNVNLEEHNRIPIYKNMTTASSSSMRIDKTNEFAHKHILEIRLGLALAVNPELARDSQYMGYMDLKFRRMLADAIVGDIYRNVERLLAEVYASSIPYDEREKLLAIILSILHSLSLND